MLSVHGGAARAVASATMRRSGLTRVLTTSAVAMAPVTIALAWRSPAAPGWFVAGAAISGASVGWIVDDVRGDVLDPVVVSRRRRQGARASVAVVAVSALIIAIATVGRAVDAALAVAAAAPVTAASAAIGIAAASYAVRVGERQAGSAGISGALFTLSASTLLQRRFAWLPSALPSEPQAAWWWVALAGAATAGVLARDPRRA